MGKTKDRFSALEIAPLTPERWGDFEGLFGIRGACGGCWCMWYRLSKAKFDAGKGEANRRAMKRLVGSGATPGLLAYRGDRAIGWCSVAPREEFPRLAGSRILRPVDATPVWSIVCLFVEKTSRRQGVSTRLLRAAAEYVREQGGRVVEGYALDPKKQLPDAFAFHGLVGAYRAAGFREVARRSPQRPIMRRVIRR